MADEAAPITTPFGRLTNLREIGGPGFQAGRRRTVYRANTEPVGVGDYPPGLTAVLDLRREDEIDRVPHPLYAEAGYRRVPLFDPASQLEAAAEAVHLHEQYIDWLERHRATIPAVFAALAATDGVDPHPAGLRPRGDDQRHPARRATLRRSFRLPAVDRTRPG